ncbi:lysophospholipid acyltransferase family protein [Rhodococcus sp. NPDC003348]
MFRSTTGGSISAPPGTGSESGSRHRTGGHRLGSGWITVTLAARRRSRSWRRPSTATGTASTVVFDGGSSLPWVRSRSIDGGGGVTGARGRGPDHRAEEHPEGTRSPDGRLHRGRTGTVRIAMDTCVPLVPVRITGTRPDPCVPWWCRRVGVEILEPSELAPFRNAGGDGGRAATDAGNPRRLTWSCTMVGWQFLRAGLRARPVLSHWQPRPVERQGFSAPLRWLPCWEQRRSAMPTTARTACRTWCTSFFSAA